MKIGIDKLGFYTSEFYIDMAKLAQARGEDPNKYLIGLGQEKMAAVPPTQDAVTLAANAAAGVLDDGDREQISFVILATESGIDNSKAGAIYVADLLGLKKNIRTLEVKQACYSATAALQLARGYISLHPTEKVLVIASDIARYGLQTKGEPTQGGGAVAILMSAEPRLVAFDADSAFYSENVMDFWRPLGNDTALVDGHYSTNIYLDLLNKTFQDYQAQNGYQLDDFAGFAFHLPFTKQGKKGMQALLAAHASQKAEYFMEMFEVSRQYNKHVGNLYTGSLYLSLLSLLENSSQLQAGDRLGLYSYGSGAVGEFYSVTVQPGFRKWLQKQEHQQLLNHRQEVTITTYEKMFTEAVVDGTDRKLDTTADHARFVLAGVKDHKRVYLSR